MTERVLNVVVAPRMPGLAIRSVLRDWSALGLVSDVHWLIAEAADPPADGPDPRADSGGPVAGTSRGHHRVGREAPPVIRISAGVATAVDLQAELARWGALTQARICILDPMAGRTSAPEPVEGPRDTGPSTSSGTGGGGSGTGGGGAGTGGGGSGTGGDRPRAGNSDAGVGAGTLLELGTLASRLVTAAAPGVPQRLVHVLATPLDAPGTIRPEVRQGWHGVLIAPQDAQTPLAPRRQIRASDDPHAVAMHLASGLAAVLGLWQGFDGTPVDQLRAGPADQVRLSQSYLHRRDASVFGARLRAAITDVHPELPAPVAEHRPLPRVQDTDGATAAAAEGLFGLHGWVLHQEREPLPERSAQHIGVRQAVVMFASFLWAALRRSPQRWWQRLVARGSRKLAAVAQNMVFGADSEYDVVVRGWLPNGQLATPTQITDATRSILRRLEPGIRHEEATATFPDLWRDFHGVALDLADGGHRVPGVPVPHFAGQPAVVGTAPAIAPGPWEAFSDIPPHLAAALGVSEISASDLRTTELVTQRLERILEHRGDLAIEANALRSAILAWSRRTQQASFAGRVGGRLAGAQSRLRREIEGIHSTLAGLESAVAPDQGFAEQQKRLSRWARWLFWIGVLVIAALLLAWNRAWLAPGTALGWVIVAIVVQLVAQLILFLRGQQALFQLLHRQQQIEDEAQVGVRNLTTALTDLQRVDAASRQFVPVAEALGSFVAQPLGVPEPAVAGIDVPADRLPQSLKIGAVEADRVALQRLLEPLRHRLFAVGWMEEPYRRFLSDAFSPSGAPVVQDPGRLLAEPAAGADAPLNRWTARLRTAGTPAALGDEIWGRALQWLASPEFLVGAGIPDLPTRWSGGEGPVHGLGAGLDRGGAAGAEFDTAVLAPGARSGRGRLVDPDAVVAASRSDGMSRSHLLVVLGQPFDTADLDVAAPATATAPRPTPLPGPRF